MSYFYKLVPSPVGILKLVASDKALAAVLWENDDPKRVPLTTMVLKEDHDLLAEVEAQLKSYFAGQLKQFSLPLHFIGTEFQQEVWQALLTIPFGETRSYQEIALQINRPHAVRAVGAANGKNPISIIVPCHRVIGADGKLTGFAGGLHHKKYLLDLENVGSASRVRQSGNQLGLF